MDIAARIDEHGKAAWIALLVLSFVLFWPIGLALLAYVIWSGRMGCGKHGGPGRWYFNTEREGRHGPWGRWGFGRQESSGNRAFDEYRMETLKRLEEEQKEFREFLDRLRHAKDKAEFDQFMADRGRRGPDIEQPQAS
jgi:Protein of unknown function (DUF2852)